MRTFFGRIHFSSAPDEKGYFASAGRVRVFRISSVSVQASLCSWPSGTTWTGHASVSASSRSGAEDWEDPMERKTERLPFLEKRVQILFTHGKGSADSAARVVEGMPFCAAFATEDSSIAICSSGGRPLLPPLFAAIQTRDEDCHRLICRARLHLIVGTLALPASRARELVRRAVAIPL